MSSLGWIMTWMRCGQREDSGWDGGGLASRWPTLFSSLPCLFCLRGAPRCQPPPAHLPKLRWATPTPSHLGPCSNCPQPSTSILVPHPLHSTLNTPARGGSHPSAPQDPTRAPISPKSYRAPQDLAPITAVLSVLPSAPCSLHCSHTGLLTAPHKQQASTCPRAFALAAPSPGTPLQTVTQLSLCLLRSWLSKASPSTPYTLFLHIPHPHQT